MPQFIVEHYIAIVFLTLSGCIMYLCLSNKMNVTVLVDMWNKMITSIGSLFTSNTTKKE